MDCSYNAKSLIFYFLNIILKKGRFEMKKEEWMNICERVDTIAISGWKFETHNKEIIKDYFECDAQCLDWLDSVGDKEVLFTLFIYPENEAAEWALGIWSMSGGDVGPGYDNRIYEQDDYDGVVQWLRKQANGGERGGGDELCKMTESGYLEEMKENGI